jgi:hypothetical protein
LLILRGNIEMISVNVFGTLVKVKLLVVGNIILLWGGVAWYGLLRNPDRGLWSGILLGFLSMVLLLIADFGHAMSHIFSARYAGAPMAEILISAGMPRTLYSDNQVPPRTHRVRAMGGPIFSGIGLLLSLILYAVFTSGSIGRELAAWSIVGHGFILVGCLLPLPIVDGGTILKWTLVEKGRTETEADVILRRVNWVLGIICGAVGMGLIAGQLWVSGLVTLGIGIVAFGVAIGKIR